MLGKNQRDEFTDLSKEFIKVQRELANVKGYSSIDNSYVYLCGFYQAFLYYNFSGKDILASLKKEISEMKEKIQDEKNLQAEMELAK